jgi:short-subunit dehydrogenase
MDGRQRIARSRSLDALMQTMEWTLITGASDGFGREFAKVAASEGHNLILVARQAEKIGNARD